MQTCITSCFIHFKLDTTFHNTSITPFLFSFVLCIIVQVSTPIAGTGNGDCWLHSCILEQTLMEAPSCIRNGLHSYTYNQEVAPNKSSRLIPKAGHKALYLKSALVSNRPLTVAAYHNGNGSVTLGLSTTNGQQHFDRVLRNSSDIKWHKRLQGGDRAATCNKWYQHYGRCRGDTRNCFSMTILE
jgi:hypothetical protein